MNEDRMKGSLKETQGDLKQAAGKATDNDKLKRDGQADRLEGKVRHLLGRMKDVSQTRH